MEYANFGNTYEIQARQVCTLRALTTLSFSYSSEILKRSILWRND